MKQTAVEFAEELIKVILYYLDEDELERIQEVIDEAKKMERQQIIDAYDVEWDPNIKNGNDYYSQTFNIR